MNEISEFRVDKVKMGSPLISLEITRFAIEAKTVTIAQ